jgi:hypothetical protein
MEFVKRENEILSTLNKLVEEELDFVVVGGYAVSGLGKHRFSVDCDVVISKSELCETEELLQRCGFERNVEKTGFDETYAGEFLSYKKKVGALPVTFDLLVASLVCRTTNAAWSFDYIKKYSAQATIAGIETVASCRIPEKELMIAFKIHSARKTDVRDIIKMIENANLDKVLNHLKRGKTELLKTHVSNIMEMLNDVKLIDSLKGVFRLTVDVKKQIEDTQKNIESLWKGLR